jgi:hypothetical protein
MFIDNSTGSSPHFTYVLFGVGKARSPVAHEGEPGADREGGKPDEEPKNETTNLVAQKERLLLRSVTGSGQRSNPEAGPSHFLTSSRHYSQPLGFQRREGARTPVHSRSLTSPSGETDACVYCRARTVKEA